MDFLIQQDGRVQTRYAVNPDLHEFRTVEMVPMDYRVGLQLPHEIPPCVPTIERRFRRVYRDRNITVWVEQR